MSIDWFTFTAQIVNFLVLVGLLKRFLYGPITRAMQEREDKIAERLEEAEQKNHAAEKQAESYRQKNEQIDQQRESLIAEAKQNADAQHKELLAEAREKVDGKRNQWLESVASQQEVLIQAIRQRTTQQLESATRKALEELADVELEQRIAMRFVSRLGDLDDEHCQRLAEAIRSDHQPPIVRMAFDASESTRSAIRDALRDKLRIDGDVAFKTSPDVICGIELQAGGQKLGWSVNEFLRTLDDTIRDVVSNASQAHRLTDQQDDEPTPSSSDAESRQRSEECEDVVD